MEQKNTTTLTLMISSILLLVILQIFWLHNSYEKAFFDFKRQTSTLFRNAALELRDSLLVKSVVPIHEDSIDHIVVDHKLPGHNFSKAVERGAVGGLTRRLEIDEDHERIQIILSNEGDTIQKNIIGPITARIASIQSRKPGSQKTFMFRLGPDTLNIDTLRQHFQKSLMQEGIDAPFSLSHLEFKPEIEERIFPRMMDGEGWTEHMPVVNIFSDTMRSEPVRINPLHRYTASITGTREIILKEISPQLLFSLFLTLITTASFIFMYRNIRTQQRLMESKNEFISNVTHELKTPIATVSVALEALKNFSAMHNPKLTEEYLDIALRELNRLSGMTDKILNASLMEKQGLIFEQEDVDLDLAVHEMLTSMKMVFEKRNALINYTTSGKNFEIKGNTLHLTNVLYNLVDNALKYSTEKPVIEITLRGDLQKIQLTVTDHGVGIPSTYQRKIFEKFFRVPTGDVHNIKGYGLGLSYVASVVKSHGGTIDVESKAGEGSSFFVKLPRSSGKFQKINY
jgi:two-component system phosphate regulon sensor histidine kinase PhoR